MKTKNSFKYGRTYKKIREMILAQNPVCYWCKEKPATQLDHEPPIASFDRPELWQGQLLPSCAKCNLSRGATFGNKKRKAVRRSRSW